MITKHWLQKDKEGEQELTTLLDCGSPNTIIGIGSSEPEIPFLIAENREAKPQPFQELLEFLQQVEESKDQARQTYIVFEAELQHTPFQHILEPLLYAFGRYFDRFQ